MHLHFECQYLSTNSWAYFLDEAVIANALPQMMATEILKSIEILKDVRHLAGIIGGPRNAAVQLCKKNDEKLCKKKHNVELHAILFEK